MPGFLIEAVDPFLLEFLEGDGGLYLDAITWHWYARVVILLEWCVLVYACVCVLRACVRVGVRASVRVRACMPLCACVRCVYAFGLISSSSSPTFRRYPLLSNHYSIPGIPPADDPLYAEPAKLLEPFVLDEVGYFAETIKRYREMYATSSPTLARGDR